MARTHAHGGTVVSALNNRDEISYLREPANYANPRRVKTIPLITLETINYDGGSKGTDREWKFVRLPVSSRCHIMPHPPLFPLSLFLSSILYLLSFFLFFSPVLLFHPLLFVRICRPPNASGNERRTIFLGGGASAADKYGLRAYSEEHPTGFAVSRTA